VRIVSHLPAATATTHAGRHRTDGRLASCTSAVVGIVGPTWARWTTPRLRAPGPRSLIASAGAHALTARHQRRSRRRRSGPPRAFVTTVGFVVAAAPWTLVFFAPVSQGAQPPSLASQATTSVTQPDYAPLLVVPLDSSGPGGGVSAAADVTFAPSLDVSTVVNVGAAPPPPLWLINAQLREPASAIGSAPLVPSAILDSLKSTGIPRLALAAYINAAASQDRQSPACGLSWQVLAGIGYIESDHARSGGSANPGWSGIANPPIYGPLLDGSSGIALISDTDHGALDGNATYDRAVGPMQFLPATWREYEEGASGHSTPDPQNINDATISAARYLCASGQDLRTADGLIAAVYGYNHSFNYVSAVLSVAIRYAGGTLSGGASALKELPALAQTASSLPSAFPTPSLPASPTPSPTPSPMAPPTPPPSPSSGPSTPPPAPVYPQPPAPVPTPTPSAPALPVASPPQASASPTDSPTGTDSPTASPTDSPTPSDDPSPTDTTSDSPAPEPTLPSSESPSPSVLESTSPTPAATTETP
jgi:hypothetical protein